MYLEHREFILSDCTYTRVPLVIYTGVALPKNVVENNQQKLSVMSLNVPLNRDPRPFIPFIVLAELLVASA
jgi:hypothetical protein